MTPPILEVNPQHPLVRTLQREQEGARFDDWAHLLYEQAMLSEPANAAAQLSQIRALGSAIAIDDFGTGYSSLSLLARLPIDYLKIDSGFTRSLDGSDRDRIVVRAIVDLARALGLLVVAEGIEKEAQLDRLNAIVHPAVRDESARRFAAAFAADPDAVVVYDVPLLVEARADDPWDLIVVADAPGDLRARRLVELRGLTEDEARARLASQVSDADRRAIADVVIDTSVSLKRTRTQTDALWERVRPR